MIHIELRETEGNRHAECWRRMNQLCERTRRQDAGRPVLELIQKKGCRSGSRKRVDTSPYLQRARPRAGRQSLVGST